MGHAGPAAHLAAILKEEGIDVGGVVLHAPYISVHKIVAARQPSNSNSNSTTATTAAAAAALAASDLILSFPLFFSLPLQQVPAAAVAGSPLSLPSIPTSLAALDDDLLLQPFGTAAAGAAATAAGAAAAAAAVATAWKPLQSFLSDKARGGSNPAFEVFIPDFFLEPPAHAATPVHTTLDATSRMQAGRREESPAGAAAARDAAAAAAKAAAAKAHGRGHAEATAAVTAAGETVSSAAVSQAAEGSDVREPSSSAAAAAATVAAAAAAEKAAAAPAREETRSSSSSGAFHRLLESGLLDSNVLNEIVGGALEETRDLNTPPPTEASSASKG
ncbi:hypothetical protein ACSSS7_008241 [Eimeria intestinalis]